MNLTHEQQAIAEAEKIKYRYVWEHCEIYGDKHHDIDLWNRMKDDYGLDKKAEIMVLGCGDGALVNQLYDDGYNSAGIDIYHHPLWMNSIGVNPKASRFSNYRGLKKNALWDEIPKTIDGGKWDLAICADVMEHIPEILLPVVLKNISDSCNHVIFQIANMESKYGGYDLHPIKQDARWWIEIIKEHMDGIPIIKFHDGTPPGRFVIDWMCNESIRE